MMSPTGHVAVKMPNWPPVSSPLSRTEKVSVKSFACSPSPWRGSRPPACRAAICHPCVEVSQVFEAHAGLPVMSSFDVMHLVRGIWGEGERARTEAGRTVTEDFSRLMMENVDGLPSRVHHVLDPGDPPTSSLALAAGPGQLPAEGRRIGDRVRGDSGQRSQRRLLTSSGAWARRILPTAVACAGSRCQPG